MPTSDQYAASKCRVKIRFEDYGDEPAIPSPIFDPNNPGFNPESNIFSGGPVGTIFNGAEAFGSGGAFEVSPSSFSRTQDILPKRWHVELNSPRKADTAKLTFALEQLPLDAQIIRSASIQIFAGVISSEDFARANGSPGSAGYMLPDAVPAGYSGAGMSWEIFRGFVDEWAVDYEAGEIEVTCRDVTSFFIDARIPENALKAVAKTVRLDEAIRLLIEGSPEDGTEGFPGAKGTVVVVETSRPLPRLGDFLGPSWFDSKGRLKRGKRRKPKAPKDMSFWDMITDLAVASGLKATLRLPRKATTIPGIGAVLPAAELVLYDAQTYYDGDGNNLGKRVFCQGLNVRDLKVTRKLGGTPVPFIEVRSWDPVAGKQIIGRYPGAPAGGVGGVKTAAEKAVNKKAEAAAAAAGASAAALGGGPVAVAAAQAAAREAVNDASRKQEEAAVVAAAGAAAAALGALPAAVAAAKEAARKAFRKGPKKVPKATRNKITPTGAGDRREYKVITVDSLSGPKATEQAEQMARSFYEQFGRGEFRVRFRTSVMNGIPANYNNEVSADMLLMRPADPIDVYVEPSRLGVVVSSDGDVALAPLEEVVRRMTAVGLSEEFAKTAARAMRDPRVQRTFRVQAISVDFDARTGYEFSVESINFLDARYKP